MNQSSLPVSKDQWPIHASHSISGEPLCGYAIRRIEGTTDFELCPNEPTFEDGRCAVHTKFKDLSPAQISVGPTTYEDYIPAEYRDLYRQSQANPDAVALGSDIAVSTAMVAMSLREMEQAPFDHRAAQKALWKLDEALVEGDGPKLADAIHALKDSIEGAAARQRKITQLQEWVATKRSLSATEVDRMKLLGQYATAAQITAYISQVIAEANDCFAAHPTELRRFLSRMLDLSQRTSL